MEHPTHPHFPTARLCRALPFLIPGDRLCRFLPGLIAVFAMPWEPEFHLLTW